MMNPERRGTEIQIEVFEHWISQALLKKPAINYCPNCGEVVERYDLECVNNTSIDGGGQMHFDPGLTFLRPCGCWVRRPIKALVIEME
jgi:hypothetical protein